MRASAVSAVSTTVARMCTPTIGQSSARWIVAWATHQGGALKIVYREAQRNFARLDILIGLDATSAPRTSGSEQHQPSEPDRDCDYSKGDARSIGERR